MVQDYEREQEERNERLGKKGPRPVQCGAVYATKSENDETKQDTSDPQAVDLKQVLKELKNLQVKVDTHLKNNAAPKQNNPPPKPKPKKQQPQVQCGNITMDGAHGVRKFQAPFTQQTSWKPKADEQPRVFRGKCYNCKDIGHTMVMCPLDLDMDKVKANVDEVKLLIARRKAAEEDQPQQELPQDEGNK